MKFLEIILNVIIRVIFGVVGIYAVNAVFQQIGAGIFVGINTWTMGTVAVLGMPGFFLLYGIVTLDKI